MTPGVKGQTRALEKLQKGYGGDASMLKDLARVTVTYADAPALERGIKAVIGGALDVVQVTNTCTDPERARTDP